MPSPLQQRRSWRILYIEPHHDIDVVRRELQKTQYEDIALVLPHGSLVSQSLMGIRLLRRYADHYQKNLAIISRERHVRKHAFQMGLVSATDIEQLDIPSISGVTVEAERMSIHSYDPEKPSEAGITTAPSQSRHIGQHIMKALQRPTKSLLLGLLGLIFAVFSVVVALTIPDAMVNINPKAFVIESTTNIQIRELSEGENLFDIEGRVLPAQPFSVEVSDEYIFSTQEEQFVGSSAEGRVEITNRDSTAFRLQPQTRLVTEEGAVVLTQSWLLIPAGGTIQTFAVAAERDLFGEPQGIGGNLPLDTSLSVVGLSDEEGALLSLRTVSEFLGGADGSIPLVTEEGLEQAENEAIARASSQAYSLLQSRLRGEGLDDFILLPQQDYLESEVLSLTFPENILGAEISSFPVEVTLRATALAYSQSDRDALLLESLQNSLRPGMELVSRSSDLELESTSQPIPGVRGVRMTFTARGVEAYALDPGSSVASIQFMNRVREDLSGLSLSEAVRVLENYPEVSSVDIALWPPFRSRFPLLPENIEVIIEK